MPVSTECAAALLSFRYPSFKIIISQKSNAAESNHSDESDIGEIYITFSEKHFSAKVYWRCKNRSKLPYLPLSCHFGETLFCCQYAQG